MDQKWFEMLDIRRRQHNNASWVPLIASVTEKGKIPYAYSGHIETYLGINTLAVPNASKTEAEKLDWQNFGLGNDGRPTFEGNTYIPVDIYNEEHPKFSGIKLVIVQDFNNIDTSEYHLNQDFVMALGLKREADIWVRPSEGYEDVAKLTRNADGEPVKLEVRAIHLKDYLCARGMSLLLMSYRSRVEIADSADHITWDTKGQEEVTKVEKWEGRIWPIHEGQLGMPYGEKMAVFHSGRTDIDPEEDVPVFGPPTDHNTSAKAWERTASGRKVFRVEGNLWRTEWIDPAGQSAMVRGDKVLSTIHFITDNNAKEETQETLIKSSRWLWFRPEVIMSLADRRGGSLGWSTRDTGVVGCSPDYSVHFGINTLGLVNVYAKDIGLLPEWQKKIWVAHNVPPEGGVSEELLASQMKADPASTQAPEAFLQKGIEQVNKIAEEKLGIPIFRSHEKIAEILTATHRFRATNQTGLYSLAKDLARLTADSIDAKALQKIVAPPKGENWRSLKSLEKVLESHIDPELVRLLMEPLVGIYELRHADAHLPSNDVNNAFALASVNQSSPYVFQGYQMLNACVMSLFTIIYELEKSEKRSPNNKE